MENRLEIIISFTCTCFTLILICAQQRRRTAQREAKHKNMDAAVVLQSILVIVFICCKTLIITLGLCWKKVNRTTNSNIMLGLIDSESFDFHINIKTIQESQWNFRQKVWVLFHRCRWVWEWWRDGMHKVFSKAHCTFLQSGRSF